MLTKSGFSHIGSGDYRTVYAIPDAPRVIKIAKNTLGVKENLAAIENWRQAEQLNVDCYLAELHEYSSDGWWILQEHISETAPPTIAPLKDTLTEAGVTIAEVNRHNVGTRNGSAILLDYGGSQ